MPNSTQTLGLTKPLKNERYNVDVFNENADKIDRLYANTIEDLKAKTGCVIGDIVEVLGYYAKGDGGGHPRQKKPVGYNGADAVIGVDGSIWGIVHNGIINATWLGCDKTGISDSSSKINAITEQVRRGISENNEIYYGINTLMFPTGKFLLNNPINLTSLGDTVPFKICGNGAYFNTHSQKETGTTFFGETGREVIDLSGSKNITLENFSISDKPVGHSTNPSNIGIVLARAKDNGQGLVSPVYCQDNKLENIIIKLSTKDALINNGNGSIGLYNFASEVNQYNNLKIIADTPLYMSCSNELNFSSKYIETFINPKTDQYTMSLNNFDNISLYFYKNPIILDDIIDSSFSNFGLFNWSSSSWGRAVIFRGSHNERIEFNNFHCEEVDNAFTLQSSIVKGLVSTNFNVVNNSKPIIEGSGTLNSCNLNIGCQNKNYWDSTGYKANGTFVKLTGDLQRANMNVTTDNTWFDNMFDTNNCRIFQSSINYLQPYDAITGLKPEDEMSIKCLNKSFESLNTNQLYKRLSHKINDDIIEAWIYKSGRNIEIKGCIKFKKDSNYYNKSLGVVLTEFKPSLGYSTINSSNDGRVLEVKIQPSGEIILEDLQKNYFSDNQMCVCDINMEYDLS